MTSFGWHFPLELVECSGICLSSFKYCWRRLKPYSLAFIFIHHWRFRYRDERSVTDGSNSKCGSVSAAEGAKVPAPKQHISPSVSSVKEYILWGVKILPTSKGAGIFQFGILWINSFVQGSCAAASWIIFVRDRNNHCRRSSIFKFSTRLSKWETNVIKQVKIYFDKNKIDRWIDKSEKGDPLIRRRSRVTLWWYPCLDTNCGWVSHRQ